VERFTHLVKSFSVSDCGVGKLTVTCNTGNTGVGINETIHTIYTNCTNGRAWDRTDKETLARFKPGIGPFLYVDSPLDPYHSILEA
jgi:hypothetical protein